jgi:hypothetical protein
MRLMRIRITSQLSSGLPKELLLHPPNQMAVLQAKLQSLRLLQQIVVHQLLPYRCVNDWGMLHPLGIREHLALFHVQGFEPAH